MGTSMNKNETGQSELNRADQFLQKKIIRRAMHLLEDMDRTEKGLREKLAKSKYPPEMIDHAIEYVKSYGYIDDKRYACNYIRYRLDSKSKQQLYQALYRKGINKMVFQEAWEEVTQLEEPDERQLIRKLLDKKCKGQTQLSEKEYRRVQGFLARRGFGWEDVSSVMREKGICMIRE